MNTDGASFGNSGLVGCGDDVRDEHGNWIAGFSRSIGITSSFVAELWGLRDELILCCNLNVSSLVVELDAKAIVNIFHNASYENIIVFPILDNCSSWCPSFVGSI